MSDEITIIAPTEEERHEMREALDGIIIDKAIEFEEGETEIVVDTSELDREQIHHALVEHGPFKERVVTLD